MTPTDLAYAKALQREMSLEHDVRCLSCGCAYEAEPEEHGYGSCVHCHSESVVRDLDVAA